MISVECIIALSMSIVEIIRKSKPNIKVWSPLIALGLALLLGILNAYLGGQDLSSSITDIIVKACTALGLFAGGTFIGSRINPPK